VCCSLLQCVTFCRAFCDFRKENGQTLTYKETMIGVFIVLQCVAVCCSVLQCVAVCCSVLQCVVVCRACRAFCALLKEKGQTPTDEETMIGTLQCVAMCRALCALVKEKGHTPTEETRIGVCACVRMCVWERI